MERGDTVVPEDVQEQTKTLGGKIWAYTNEGAAWTWVKSILWVVGPVYVAPGGEHVRFKDWDAVRVRLDKELEGTLTIPAAQPKNKEGTRYVCTAAMPYKETYPRALWMHPSSHWVGDEYYGLSGGGNYEVRFCPLCGLTFRATLPD